MQNQQINQKNVFSKFLAFTKTETIMLMTVTIIGLVLMLFASHYTGLLPKTLEEIGHVTFIGGVLMFLEHKIIKAEEKKTMAELIKEVVCQSLFDKEELKTVVNEIVKANSLSISDIHKLVNVILEQELPQKNLSKIGITKATDKFEITKVLEELAEVKNSVIRIHKIFIPFHTPRIEEALLNAIVKNNNTVQVVLCHPHAKEALEKRSFGLPKTHWKDIQRQILANERELKRIYDRLPNDKKANLQVKRHKSFIGVSFFGYGDKIWFGLYLNNRVATEGTMIQASGSETFLYNELLEHFLYDWNSPTTQTVKFDDVVQEYQPLN